MTPVALATKMGMSHCLAVLLRSGGSPHRVVNGALTPLQVAIVDRKPKCLSLLITAGANPLDPRDCPSASYAAERRELLGMEHRSDTPGARVLRVLLQAEGYTTASWQWPYAATATSTFDYEGKRRKKPRMEQEGPRISTASTRWIAPRRGMFLPSVLRSVERLPFILSAPRCSPVDPAPPPPLPCLNMFLCYDMSPFPAQALIEKAFPVFR